VDWREGGARSLEQNGRGAPALATERCIVEDITKRYRLALARHQLATFCHREWRERLARDLDGLPMGLIAATPQIPLLSRTG
jgi:hypothetical protein